VPSPLTIEDLGQGDWVGPVDDPEVLDGAPRHHWCGAMSSVEYVDSHSIDEQEAYFGNGQTQVVVRADRYQPGDSYLRDRFESVRFLDQCVVEAEDGPSGPVNSAAVRREPDGAFVLESHVTQSSHDFEITVAIGVDEEWLVVVEVSHLEGAEGPDAVELLDRALANLKTLPAPEPDEESDEAPDGPAPWALT